MKLAVPDLVSNSDFPADAAVALGCFAAEGQHYERYHAGAPRVP